MRLLNLFREFHNEESGQGFVEYLLIIALIGLAVVVGMRTAANYVNNAFSNMGSKMQSFIGT